MVGGGLFLGEVKARPVDIIKQLKHKDRHAILSSPPSLDTPATLRAYATSLLPCYSLLY